MMLKGCALASELDQPLLLLVRANQ